MAQQVEARINNEVVCTGELTHAPYAFWHGVRVDSATTDVDALIERLQASKARWEGYLNSDGSYMLLLPPIFQVTKIETVF